LARQRLAQKFEPTLDVIRYALEYSDVAYLDETGWRLGGRPAWLWVNTNDVATLYDVEKSRGHEVAEKLLAKEFAGVLSSDCFSAYDPIRAEKNKCVAHILRAFKALVEENRGRALAFPKRAMRIFQDAIQLKPQRAGHRPSRYARLCRKLEARLDRLLAGTLTNPGNLRLARRLRKHRDALLTFLYHENVDPTNNHAERALRPAVIARKLSAGNRSPAGAKAFTTFASIIRTCRQTGQDFLKLAEEVICSPEPVLVDFVDGRVIPVGAQAP